jgi:hypothetical protein
MSRILNFLMLAVTASVCLGATERSFVSGDATAYENHREIQQVALTTNQLQALSRWLEPRQGHWRAHITEPSIEPVYIWLDLTRADGNIDHLGVITAGRGGHYMRLSVGPGIQWAYRSFAGFLKTRYAQQSINENDLLTLRQLLFEPSTP